MAKRRAKGEGAAYLIKSGRRRGLWAAALDLGWINGKRKRKYFYAKTQADVLKALREARRKQDKGVDITADRITVAQYLDRWLELKAGHLAPRTLRSYRDNVRMHIAPKLGEHRLIALRRSHVQAFADLKSKDPALSARTADYLVSILSSALNDAIDDRLLEWNPASRIRVDVPKPEKDPLTPEEALTFLEAIRAHRWRAMFVVALTTGMREGEILGMTWDAIDWKTKVYRLRKQLQRIDKKFALVDTKTDGSADDVPLGELAIAALEGHRAAQRELRLRAGDRWEETGAPSTWPVFTTARGRWLHQRTVLTEFQRILAGAGIRRRTFHDLRHSTASIANALGANIVEISRLLRHSGIKITADTYTKVFEKARHDLAGRMDAALSGPRPKPG